MTHELHLIRISLLYRNNRHDHTDLIRKNERHLVHHRVPLVFAIQALLPSFSACSVCHCQIHRQGSGDVSTVGVFWR